MFKKINYRMDLTFPGIPAFFFLDGNAKEKDKIIGGDKADKFLKSLKALK